MKKNLMSDKTMNIGCARNKENGEFYINFSHLLSWLTESNIHMNKNIKIFVDNWAKKNDDNYFININFLKKGNNPFECKNDKIFINLEFFIKWLNSVKSDQDDEVQDFIDLVVKELNLVKERNTPATK